MKLSTSFIIYQDLCIVLDSQQSIRERSGWLSRRGIKEICIEIGKRYYLYFKEMGTDKDSVYFLI